MAITLVRPSCRGSIRTPDESAGKQGKCPPCGSPVKGRGGTPLADKDHKLASTQDVSGTAMAQRVVVVDLVLLQVRGMTKGG